ncbi:peptide/nickel transport system ATP-binding protein [Cryobacterium mesophilum]|uniref:ABC transporter ATP-binding protein n=1 Tax=Terrimesophilobacter mesophilus TaxID=433647 RepID=A0A4R8VEB4_9MICO|nr:ABC transporter ATP-binding protein [Terrimesophilobacter mesophilus]MBB5633823.1 peptide/nickel transport system ATP-binding protein [Terrimesophilobacter mesophilus]TFB80502.1 ABC transporter ATP-binding protein [Terrimesophilobacter mesophilus]
MTDIDAIDTESATENDVTPEASANVPVLEVKDLSVDFGVDNEWVPAAIKLNYQVKKGEVLAIVGESGSGKSASSMAVLNLLPVNSRIRGSVKLNGVELRGMRDNAMRRVRGEKIAVIFQEPMTALNPVYTVGFQIVETLRQHYGISPAAAKIRAIELLTMVEMPDPPKAFNSYPHQLSGGQRQRAMIAQSISCDPDLLIADEPTTALDVTVQAEILDLLRNLHKRLDSAIVLITHDMGVVADLADRVVVMRNGLIVETGTVHQIFAKPVEPYTIELLSAVPHLGTNQERLLPKTEEAREPVLSLKHVTIDYPKRGRVPAFRAVDDVSIEIHPGELLGLVGESGSGKTTIGRAAMGLLPITEGELRVVGKDMANMPTKELRLLRRKTGIVFQDPASSLNPRMPVGQSIGEPMMLAGVAKGKDLDRKVEDLLEQVELPTFFRNRYPHELSGGQKQRIGIARALSLSPELLVADEPTSALDVSVQSRFLELLLELQEQLDFACLFISHDLAVVDQLAHRIAVLRNGKLVEQGTRDEILRGAKDPYTQRLIAAVPLPDPDLQRESREQRLAARL